MGFGRHFIYKYRFVIKNKAQEVKMGNTQKRRGEGSRVSMSFACTHLSQHFYVFTELGIHYSGIFGRDLSGYNFLMRLLAISS